MSCRATSAVRSSGEDLQACANRLATTGLLLAAIFFIVYTVLRRSFSRPVAALLGGARALGRGDLDYRVSVGTGGDELGRLTTEFNRMADSIAEQRRAAEIEAGNRLNLERERRRSERLAAVGRLAAGIAHELDAPLNVIDARAQARLRRDLPAASVRCASCRI